MLDLVLSAYGFPSDVSVTRHGSGLINRTWIVRHDRALYILQQVNHEVFTRPQWIADNIEMIGRYLAQHYPGIIFPCPVKTTTGETLVHIDGKYYRLYPFIENSVTIDVAHTPAQAYEAAKQ